MFIVIMAHTQGRRILRRHLYQVLYKRITQPTRLACAPKLFRFLEKGTLLSKADSLRVRRHAGSWLVGEAYESVTSVSAPIYTVHVCMFREHALTIIN